MLSVHQRKLTLYTPGHIQIVWDVFAKKSTDIMNFCNSFITISTYTTIQKYHKTTALFCLLFLLFTQIDIGYTCYKTTTRMFGIHYTLMLTLCKNRGGFHQYLLKIFRIRWGWLSTLIMVLTTVCYSELIWHCTITNQSSANIAR